MKLVYVIVCGLVILVAASLAIDYLQAMGILPHAMPFWAHYLS